MLKKIKPENLPIYIAKIESLFPEFQSYDEITALDIQRYYHQSYWGYALFHSWSGAIHMALSKGDEFSKNDYFRQAEEMEQTIAASTNMDRPLTILEVGCGRGFNIRYLAEKYPKHQFVGIDLSAKNVTSAHRLLEDSPNATAFDGDFHKLDGIDTNSVDIVFAVETLCHSSEISKAFAAMTRVLTPGGTLVVYDGFRSGETDLSVELAKALQYTERAMAVPAFVPVEEFLEKAKNGGFTVEKTEDRSEEIMPNLIRLSDLAKAFFKIRIASKLILLIVPRGLVANAIAGLLMGVTVQSGAHRYFRMVFTKQA